MNDIGSIKKIHSLWVKKKISREESQAFRKPLQKKKKKLLPTAFKIFNLVPDNKMLSMKELR